MECPRMDPHRILTACWEPGWEWEWIGIAELWGNKPGALGDLGSHRFPSWPSPQSKLSPVSSEGLSASPLTLLRGRGWRKCWQWSGLGRALPCRLWVGATHIPLLLRKLSIQAGRVLMMWTGLSSCCSLCHGLPSFPSFPLQALATTHCDGAVSF